MADHPKYDACATAMQIGDPQWVRVVCGAAFERIGKEDAADEDIYAAIGAVQGELFPYRNLIREIEAISPNIELAACIEVARRVRGRQSAYPKADQSQIILSMLADYWANADQYAQRSCKNQQPSRALAAGADLYYYAVLEQAGLFRAVDELDARWEAGTAVLNGELGTRLNDYTARPQDHVQPHERAQYYLRVFGDIIVPPFTPGSSFKASTTFALVWNTFIDKFSNRSRQGPHFADREVTDGQLQDSADELIADLQTSLDGRVVAGAVRLGRDVAQVTEILTTRQYLDLITLTEEARNSRALIAEVLVKAPGGDKAARTLHRKAAAGRNIISMLDGLKGGCLDDPAIKALGTQAQKWQDATGTAPPPPNP